MLNLILIGTGNVGSHLFNAFEKSKEVTVVQVVGRTVESLDPFSKHTSVTTDYGSIKDADVYIVAVKDDAVGKVSERLVHKKGLVVHTSGALDMDVLRTENRGVFYPLQTFTKGRALDFKSIPICVEAKDQKSMGQLNKLALQISENVHEINSKQRKKLHLAAVFVNNFTNYLYGVGEDICLSEGLTFDLLKPLIKETADKVYDLSPKAAQTGPAKRGDTISMQEHIKLLNEEDYKKLYTQLSELIQKTNEKEL
ncbi:DUF2520 domain-containing protein [Muricauda sp. JGD-17]|uniref:DUF2520 domain-containing protein n=1 Tax=Flagellimonas ochracea TaxID=2696472 RepID=A0A964WWV6_9FLAO|nr:Rossmann-like and DUF2520 domain-containing protein [Allomuricauda ochracea]NAY91163.1 DUF2520 domain-containing protein [Allomuricauda ochracea]